MKQALLVAMRVMLIAPAVWMANPVVAQTTGSTQSASASADKPAQTREQQKAARKRARKEARANQKAQINAARAQGQPVGPVGDDYPRGKTVGPAEVKAK
jgi:hypothetical protein